MPEHWRTSMETHDKARDYVENLGVTHSYKIVKFLLTQDESLTSKEIAQGMEIDRQIVGRRLPELLKVGVITEKKKRRCRITGQKAKTWATF
jgi:predicted transcriptional regulator